MAGKAAVGHIDPYTLTVLRWTGALLLVLPFAVRPLRRDWPVLRAKWWLLLFYGALGFGTFNALCYIAAYYTTGFNIGLDQVTINIFVMLLSFIFFRTRVKALQLVGVAITIAGVALTVSHGDITRVLALDVNLGDLLVLIASSPTPSILSACAGVPRPTGGAFLSQPSSARSSPHWSSW